MILGIMQLVALVGLLVAAFILLKVLKKLSISFNTLAERVSRPTRDEIIGKMSTGEAQKEYIRLNSIIDNKLKQFSRILANDIARVFGDN